MINKNEAKAALQIFVGAAYSVSAANSLVNSVRETRYAALRMKDVHKIKSTSPEKVVTGTS